MKTDVHTLTQPESVMKIRPISLAISLSLLAACSTSQKENAQEAAQNDSYTPPQLIVEEHAATQDAAASAVQAPKPAADMAALETISLTPAAPVVMQAETEKSIASAEAKRAPQVLYATGSMSQPQVSTAPLKRMADKHIAANMLYSEAQPANNTERYKNFSDNPVQRVAENPTSTFSIDVDTGSYSNVRRMLNQNTRPPADAVRAEEMINYFDFAYKAPQSLNQPFSITTEIAAAPWNKKRQLMMVGIKAYDVDHRKIPASNLVFLIDTSGSMSSPDKLPLLISSFQTMVEHLRPQDTVSIVVYAGSAGLVLPATRGDDKETILNALGKLKSGGSTNGGQGIALAYQVAKENFISGGVNRVILASDGDFNVGVSNTEALKTLVADQRKSGIALTTLGFGQGNYNDEMAEQLADVGNGNHAYIDTINEGKKVLVDEMSSTMMTVAQDVKIQVEFNPAVVAEYRLIGYENRKLNREDFNNDKVDAGEIGAGHDVTALYEITLVGSGGEANSPLRYGAKAMEFFAENKELAQLNVRYKNPGADKSKLIQKIIHRNEIRNIVSDRMRMAASVAAFADLLRGGKNVGDYSWDDVRTLAGSVKMADPFGYRAEFLNMIDQASGLAETKEIAQISE
jgi:Ca-activated chloride channel homolog